MAITIRKTAGIAGWSTGAFAIAAICIAPFVAWVTHCVWIIKCLASDHGATAGQIVLGLLGAFIPPIGVIHGIILWFS